MNKKAVATAIVVVAVLVLVVIVIVVVLFLVYPSDARQFTDPKKLSQDTLTKINLWNKKNKKITDVRIYSTDKKRIVKRPKRITFRRKKYSPPR